jgi:hypothetical protein
VKFDEWGLAILIANDLAELLESEPGQEDVAQYLRVEALAVFYKHVQAQWLNSRDWFMQNPGP